MSAAPLSEELMTEFKLWYRQDRKQNNLPTPLFYLGANDAIRRKYQFWYEHIYSIQPTVDRSRARLTDPETSHISASTIKSQRRDKEILRAIDQGYQTIKEVTQYIDITKETSISPRFAPLQRAGLIKVVGKKRNSMTNHLARTYQLTLAGKRQIS